MVPRACLLIQASSIDGEVGVIGEDPLHSQSTSLAKVAPLPGLAMRFLQEIGDGDTGPL
ncbi:hypothetical protein GCM10011571_00070 [Marinithermofilum abyssi]|uniref:Uncharacterized protein n=1 Tax=Marinithermofilum abyssi TaxID=1571185 RepID=A0A8J2VDV7_9BACL|nr:hypothetical protein GCM10011571_00070 [Marinithermofilum abyssi]